MPGLETAAALSSAVSLLAERQPLGLGTYCAPAARSAGTPTMRLPACARPASGRSRHVQAKRWAGRPTAAAPKLALKALLHRLAGPRKRNTRPGPATIGACLHLSASPCLPPSAARRRCAWTTLTST